jgi:hypothetical protein
MSKGIYRDSPGIIPEGFGRYNRNVVINKEGKFITNENGFQETLELLGVIYLGRIETYKETIAFYVDKEGADPKSYILRIDEGVEIIIADAVLNFNRENPIEGVFQYSQNGDLVIAWWDGVSNTSNTPKILNVDCLPFKLNDNKGLLNPADVNLIQLFPLFSCPTVTAIDEQVGTGVLQTGAYFFFTYYELNDGDKIGYCFVGNSYYVHPGDVEVYADVEGDEGGIATTKSVEVTVSNINQSFTKIGIGVAHVAKGVTRFYDYGSQIISSETLSFVLNGNAEGEVTLESISNARAYYEKVATGTVINNRLYLGNFKTSENGDLFEYFKDATVEWVYNDNSIVNLETYPISSKDSELLFFNKTFLPDEVYALYVKVQYNNGNIEIYPLVGREKRNEITWENHSDEGYPTGGSSSDLIVNEDQLISDIIEDVRENNPSNNIENLEQITNISSQAKVFHVLDTSDSDGTMGYWEQGTEVYPECYGDLAGQPVRYFKMPSLEALKKYKVEAGEDDIFFKNTSVKGPLNGVVHVADLNMSDNFTGAIRGRIYNYDNIDFPASVNGSYEPVDVREIAMDPGLYDYNATPNDIFYRNGIQVFSNQIVDVLYQFTRNADMGRVLEMNVVILDSEHNVVDIPVREDFLIYPDTEYYGEHLYENISLEAGQILVLLSAERFLGDDSSTNQRGRVDTFVRFHDDLSAGSNVYARNLGVKVSNINLPQSVKDKVDHIELCYAKRGSFNSLVKGMSIVTTNGVTGHEYIKLAGDSVRMHSFEALVDKPSLISYIKTHFRGEPTETALVNGHLYQGVHEDIDASDYRTIRAIINKTYAPENVDLGSFDNTNREEALLLTITGEMEAMSTAPNYNLVFATLYSFLLDVYDGLERNVIVRTGSKIMTSSTELTSYGGDGFITPYSFRYNTDTDIHVYNFPVYSRLNIALRKEGDDEWEKIYPLTADPTDYTPELGADGDIRNHGNYIDYNFDYNSLLDFENLNAFIVRCTSECNDIITAFPYRVHRSVQYGNESNVIRWRNFLLDDYYEMPRESGEIIALNNLNNSLAIHMRNDLYIAQNKDTLRAEELTIALGNSDIFTTTPERIMFGAEGYLGCINKWSICIYKGMYVFVNTVRGRAFMLDQGGVKEISQAGMFSEFRDNFKNIPDNPFAGNGVVTGYDTDLDRFLITKIIRNGLNIDKDKSVTYSIYPNGTQGELQWLADHDYFPSSYWQRNGQMYAIAQTEEGFTVYLMNHSGNFSNFGSEVKNSFIEVCIHTKTNENWDTVAWKTLVKDVIGNYIDDTFDQIFIRNDHQATNIIDIQIEGLTKLSKNVRRVKDYYHFNQIIDSKLDAIGKVVNDNGEIVLAELKTLPGAFNKKKFRSEYIIVRLIFDNTKNRSFFLMDVKAE